MKNAKQYKTFLVWFLFILAVLIASKLISRVRELGAFFATLGQVLMPFIVGLVLAFVLSIPAGKLEGLLGRCKWTFLSQRKRGLSVLVVYLVFFGILGTILGFAIPWVAGSIVSLIRNIPTYYNTVVQFAHRYEEFSFGGISVSSVLNQFTPQKLLEYVEGHVDMTAVSSYASGVFRFGSGVVKSFIAVIISIYMLLGKESLIHALKQVIALILPRRGRWILFHYGRVVCNTFYKYIYGQCLDAAILGTVCVIVFSLLRVPFGALLGICIGIANLIPYFGAILSGIGVAVFVLIASGPWKAVIVAVVILVVQQIDGNIMQPRIVGGNVGIKPIYVLLAITVGGGFFGVPGMIIGVPVISVLRTVVLDLIHSKARRKRVTYRQKRADTSAAVDQAAMAAEHLARQAVQAVEPPEEEPDGTE